MSDEEGRPELRPARPDAAGSEGRPSYMPRIAWRWIVVGAVGLAATFGAYYFRREQRGEALRTEMLTLHEEQLSEVAGRYLAFRNRLEVLIDDAAQADGLETWVDPRLDLGVLRAREGLYLRLPVEAARVRERIPPAARGMSPDAILSCLGVSAMNARGLYESGDFLTPEWVEELRNEESLMRLRVLEDQLGRHVQVDLPVLVDMMQAEWFMLVLQRGEDRRDHPVDVYIWDLRRDRELLRARIQARGVLLPVRLRVEGQATSPSGAVRAASGGANDCSIAAQVRALAGAPMVEVEAADALRGGEAPSDTRDAPPGPEAPPAARQSEESAEEEEVTPLVAE